MTPEELDRLEKTRPYCEWPWVKALIADARERNELDKELEHLRADAGPDSCAEHSARIAAALAYIDKEDRRGGSGRNHLAEIRRRLTR